VSVVDWTEIEPARREVGHIAGELRSFPGTVGIGAKHWRVPPGKWSTPVHVHGAEEEIFYVLSGSGVLLADGKAYAVGARDCVSCLPETEAHSFRAGDDGLELLVFGERKSVEAALLPRAGVFWLGAKWVDAGDDRHPWQRELAAGEPEVPALEAERPAWIVRHDDVAEHERAGATVGRRVRDLARAAGSSTIGLKYYFALPGMLGTPPHCHSAEEELFAVLDGDGHCLLGDDLPPTRPQDPPRRVEELPVRRGSVVARPPGTGVPHAFRAGDSGLGYLAFGTRVADDAVYYPRSNKVFFRGLNLVARLERLEYWEGED
jgi:uncharacterized cupin superfamily protein